MDSPASGAFSVLEAGTESRMNREWRGPNTDGMRGQPITSGDKRFLWCRQAAFW